jgi:ADP-ribose pyrophosphatase
MIEKTLSSHVVYQGPVFTVRQDVVAGRSGSAIRDIVVHAPAVTVLPVASRDAIYMIHQYRKAVESVLIEAPAGCIEPNESPLDAAHRELKEETGIVAKQMIPVGEMYMAPGFCNEYMTIFLAMDLTMGAAEHEPDESMTLHRYTWDDLMNKVAEGQIKDAKTILALQYLRPYIGG